MNNNKISPKNWISWLSFIFSFAVIIYVIVELDWQIVYEMFVNLDKKWLLLAWLIFMLNYMLRTYRFQLLINLPHVPFQKLLSVTSLYGMFNYLMPAKSGEFSFLFLLNRHLNISVGEGTATLATARFFDFATIALFLPVVLIVFWEDLPLEIIYISFVFCIVVYLSGGMILQFLRSGKAMKPSQIESGWLGKLQKIWHDLVQGLQLIDQRGQYGKLWISTIGIWLCVYINFYFIVLSMDYYLTFFQMVVVSIIMVPLTLLPFQGVANLGTHEIGWVIAFSLFGYTQDIALSIAVGSHMILLLFVLVLGGLGLTLSLNSIYFFVFQ